MIDEEKCHPFLLINKNNHKLEPKSSQYFFSHSLETNFLTNFTNNDAELYIKFWSFEIYQPHPKTWLLVIRTCWNRFLYVGTLVLESTLTIEGGEGVPKTAKPHRNTPKTANCIRFFHEYRNRTSSSPSAATSTTSVAIVTHWIKATKTRSRTAVRAYIQHGISRSRCIIDQNC